MLVLRVKELILTIILCAIVGALIALAVSVSELEIQERKKAGWTEYDASGRVTHYYKPGTEGMP